jgi:hypothetical protein
MGPKRPGRSFDTPRKRAAPQDDGQMYIDFAKAAATIRFDY